MLELKTDILIIGGGIAGCIAAISLANSYHVTLIDRLYEPREQIGESLAPASQRILEELNLLEDLEGQLGSLYQINLGIQSYWGSNRVHIVDHLRNPDGYAKSLNRKAFEEYLRKLLEDRGVHCIWGTKFYKSSFENSQWKTIAKSDEKVHPISSSFVIDASGRQSHFARSLGIKRKVEDKLIACWMTLQNNKENTMSIISACESGWWYSAVVPNNKRVVAFHTDSDLIDKSKLKTCASFLKLAKRNRQISDLLKGNESTIEFKGTVAANSTKLEQVAGQRWVALGDAAMSFDPLSSQGMFNAMANAMQLKEFIQQFGFTTELSKTYSHQIDQIWLHYLNYKCIFYQTETRWQTSEFWKRRHLSSK